MKFSRQEEFLTKGRSRQKQRTREALLDAAMRLARDGHSPSITEVAEAANVSTATAYRYFPNTQSLWADLGIREVTLQHLLADLPQAPEDRMETIVRRVTEMQFGNEAMWRGVLRASLERWFTQQSAPEADRVSVPRRQPRAALAPLADTLPPELPEN